MKISTYISSEQIQVIGHSGGAPKRFNAYSLPEGVVFNGVILDQPYMVKALTSLKNKNPGIFNGEVSLIVDGSSLLSRKISTPKLSRARYINLVRDDFGDTIENPGDIVCGYIELSSNESAILGYAVNREQVDTYINVFKEAGIVLASIHIGSEAILRYVATTSKLQSGTIAINVIDGTAMLTMLFVNGNNVFSSRTKLYGDYEDQMLDNILDNLNGLKQFAQAQKFGEIKRSFYLGLSDDEVGIMEENNPHSEIRLYPLSVYDGPGGAPPPETHFCCLNMILGSKCINLVEARKELDRYVREKKPSKSKFVFIILFILGLSVPALYLYIEVSFVDSDIAEARAYIDSELVARRLEQISLLRERTTVLADIVNQGEVKSEWEDSMVKATSFMLNTLIFDHGENVFVTQFDFSEVSGVARMGVRCEDATVSTYYVDVLQASGIVRDRGVSYRGYSSSDGELYLFQVDVRLIADRNWDIDEIMLKREERLRQREEAMQERDNEDEDDLNGDDDIDQQVGSTP